MVKKSMILQQGEWVPSLIGELSSCMPLCVAKKILKEQSVIFLKDQHFFTYYVSCLGFTWWKVNILFQGGPTCVPIAIYRHYLSRVLFSE